MSSTLRSACAVCLSVGQRLPVLQQLELLVHLLLGQLPDQLPVIVLRPLLHLVPLVGLEVFAVVLHLVFLRHIIASAAAVLFFVSVFRCIACAR